MSSYFVNSIPKHINVIKSNGRNARGDWARKYVSRIRLTPYTCL